MMEFINSLFRFSWTMSRFGFNSMANLMGANGVDDATRKSGLELDRVSDAVERQMAGMFALQNPAAPRTRSDVEIVNLSAPRAALEPPPVAYGGLINNTENMRTEGPVFVHMRLGNTTQGPFWPPAAQVDENGDFILVGSVLTQIKPGVIVPVPHQAVIVSKDTVPPLNSEGKEDFSNLFGASYNVIRHLDLNPGSPDLNIVLHSVSWGPFEGDWGGGGPRMPRLGDSRYNLNSFHTRGITSPEIFPSASQRKTYTRASFPLHKVPIPGFQGDQIAYDVDTGQPYAPQLKNGAACFPDGCPGEDVVNFRREESITLGEWLKAEVWLTITLTNFKKGAVGGAYTAARFDVQAKHLLPNSIYAVMMIRASQFKPSPLRKIPDTSVLPNIMVTDWQGSGRLSRIIPNPFPDPATDDASLRIVGIGIGFKPDFAVWGAYPFRLNPGADIHAQVTSFADGTSTELTSFITEPA